MMAPFPLGASLQRVPSTDTSTTASPTDVRSRCAHALAKQRQCRLLWPRAIGIRACSVGRLKRNRSARVEVASGRCASA